ncbi:hypothetical protein [Shigella phage ESh19]|nr:hypothetical protein [Shigella phage ESh19]
MCVSLQNLLKGVRILRPMPKYFYGDVSSYKPIDERFAHKVVNRFVDRQTGLVMES